jgi:rRNA processing/ribosome biogenesis
MSLCLTEWVLASAGSGVAQTAADTAIAATAAVVCAPTLGLAAREGKAWLAAATQRLKGEKHGSSAVWARAEQLLALIECSPPEELESSSGAVAAALLVFLRPQELPQTRACTLSTLASFAERIVGSSSSSNTQSRRAAIVTHLPKLVPLVLGCISEPSENAATVAVELNAASLDCLARLLSALRTSMRPYLARIEASVGSLLAAHSEVKQCPMILCYLYALGCCNFEHQPLRKHFRQSGSCLCLTCANMHTRANMHTESRSLYIMRLLC